jgi:hypothetical protein
LSNYMHLLFCKRCYQMKNHWWMEDTPRKGMFTVECCMCGHRPMQAQSMVDNAMWEDIAIEENKMEEVAE